MVRDLALAALVGPGLVVGLAVVLDLAGVIAVEGLVQRLVTLGAVGLATGAFVLLSGVRRAQAERGPASPRPRRDRVG